MVSVKYLHEALELLQTAAFLEHSLPHLTLENEIQHSAHLPVFCFAGPGIQAQDLAPADLSWQTDTRKPALAHMLHVNKNQLGLTYQSLTGS